MLKVEKVDVWGFEHAIRGMRNPLNSWSKSDSKGSGTMVGGEYSFIVGKNDLALMQKLCKAGSEHRKFMRQIFVSMDITAPLYWWKEFDTYKVGTVANSCSTMHKISAKKFEIEDFSHEHLIGDKLAMDVDEPVGVLNIVIDMLNFWRNQYVEEKERGADSKYLKDIWWQMIQLLPSSYNQKRTITINYEKALTIIKQRTGHKLDEWLVLVEKLLELPYLKEIAEL